MDNFLFSTDSVYDLHTGGINCYGIDARFEVSMVV